MAQSEAAQKNDRESALEKDMVILPMMADDIERSHTLSCTLQSRGKKTRFHWRHSK
jgi:hypothetical protein